MRLHPTTKTDSPSRGKLKNPEKSREKDLPLYVKERIKQEDSLLHSQGFMTAHFLFKDAVRSLSRGARRVLAISTLFKSKMVAQQTIGNIWGVVRETVNHWHGNLLEFEKKENLVLHTYVSGQSIRVPNIYKRHDYFLNPMFEDVLEELLSELPKNFLNSIQSICHTLIKKVILRILNTINLYTNSQPTQTHGDSPKRNNKLFSPKKGKSLCERSYVTENTHLESVQAPQPQSPISSHGSEIGIANTKIFAHTEEKNLKRDDRRLGEKANAILEIAMLVGKKIGKI